MSKQFKIKHIEDIPFETVHNIARSRKTLVTKDDLVTDNIDAFTKGFLRPQEIWDWHNHPDHDEIGIVLQGEGTFYWEDQKKEYRKDDLIIIPAGSTHKFEAGGSETSEFYFVRIQI